MTTYCQHAPTLRLVRPGQPEQESTRPRDRKTNAFLDGEAGTQVQIADDVQGFDVPFALATGAIAELPCPDHPSEVITPTRKLSGAEKSKLQQDWNAASPGDAEIMEDPSGG